MSDETAPVVGAPDDYEREYMDGDRAVLRARERQPRWVPGSALAVMVAALWLSHPTLAWMWAHRGDPGVGVALAVIAGWFALNNLALLLALLTDHITRVALTPTHLHIHRGLWTDDIALDAITSVAAEESRWWRPKHTLRGGLLRRERSYLTPGVERALCVEWRDAKGNARKIWVQFTDAPAFARQIGALTAGVTGVRAAPDAVGEVEDVGDEREALRREGGSGRRGGG